MVGGIRQSVICSYTLEGQKPEDKERERMGEIVGAFAVQGYDAYSVMLDSVAEHFTTREEYHRLAVATAASRDVLFSVVTSERRDDWMLLQAGSVIANGGRIVLAYHDTAYGSAPVLQKMASQVISWDRISELLATINTQVCNNTTNDRDTFWINQRKTA